MYMNMQINNIKKTLLNIIVILKNKSIKCVYFFIFGISHFSGFYIVSYK